MKKVKVFLIQRVVKKIKQKNLEKELNLGESKELESELIKMKSLDHVKFANWAFSSQILKDEYLKAKMDVLGVNEDAVDFNFDFVDKIKSVKCFQDVLKACKSDLIVFMRKLFHENVPESSKNNEKERAPLEKRTKDLRKPSSDKSFFMNSLNADDSDIDFEGGSDFEGRVAFTDDDEENSGYFNSDVEENKPKKKKNRLGQLARRRLAEKMYGREAKHIKCGGLTVQEKEELRKKKSQQKKERAARIKKDGANGPKFKRQNSDEESVLEFKKASTVKIDPKMHPSWAAKLQQQAKAQQTTFQGQKIKFDD